MTVDYLIIGQGICGTWLSYYLEKEGASFLVIDEENPFSSSRLSAGVINPVTGRRHVTVWMDDILVPFVREAYTDLSKELNINGFSQRDLVDFFPTPQMRLSFQQRTEENAPYLSLGTNDHQYSDLFNYELGYGSISPVYTAHLEVILPAWRFRLKKLGKLSEDRFEEKDLSVLPSEITYRDITARVIIFCDGAASSNHPWFNRLPFAPNKGEILLLEIPGLPPANIYKKGMVLVPMAEKGHWWLGSNYAWSFDNEQPTEKFREDADHLLKSWLRLPYSVTDHLAGIRPATLERRPFVGMHPHYAAIGILNGMGTKGCSLAPYFARELTDHLLHGKAITPGADIRRYSRLLQGH